ncbi:hypothetical protein CHS0354_030288 [Potamilus streckersoni]|uniref:Sema domain-containing protein n=1 Tax=Potamilus streckersoni TaxID=2493646 RepID=A0AAE0VKG7_9BIVA|nr:hypothetical protein CHS0354_030288 [Potamilus streckersoni]
MMSKTSLLSFVNLIVLTALFGRIISDNNSFSRDNLRNIVVDEENGVLYIGGDGKLYKLHIGNLSILNSIQTCDSCYSKILLKTNNNTLIVCGIDANGMCALYNATHLAKVSVSNVKRDLYVYGNRNKPAVGLLTSNGTDLYVGLTYDKETDSGLPYYFITNRVTDSTYAFNIIEKDLNGVVNPRWLKIKEEIKNSYFIYFRAVFQTEKHVYFLTNQKFQNDINSAYVSKLIRICKDDDSFYSYIDLELECKNSQGDKFNLVQHGCLIELGDKLSSAEANQALVATFAFGTDAENPWTNRSAICLYTLKEIQERIIQAQARIVSKCDAIGKLVYNESFTYIDIARPKDNNRPSCQNESFVKENLYCTKGFEGYGYLTSFDVKLNSTAIWAADDTLLGKIAGSRLAGGYSELLVGTDKGDIKKIALFNISSAVQYDTYHVDSGQPVDAIHRGKDMDYFLTSKKLVKVAASNCSKYSTCDECQGSNNPHCGWCILEEKCSTMKSCSTVESNTWIPTPAICISQKISPKAGSVNTNMTLTIMLTPFPSAKNGTYTCIFKADGIDISVVDGKRENETLYCKSPKVTTHTRAELAINMTKNNRTVKLTSQPFLFYDCSNFSRCKKCTSESDGGCNWCVSNNMVMCSTNGSCLTNYTYKQAEECPQLLDSRGKMFAANGDIYSMYSLNAQNLPDVGNFTCNVHDSTNFTAVINRTNTTILVTCRIFISNSVNAIQNMPMTLLYPNKHPVDDDYGNRVEVYRCDKLGPDCSQCRAYEEDIKSPYHCRWCNNSTTSTAGCFHNTYCMNQRMPCGPPEINSVEPKDGPLGGGTVITIEGKNFGIAANEINNITVAGIKCQNITFVDVKGIVTCITMSSVKETEGPIIISVLGNMGEKGKFTYKDPNITDVLPTTGPMAGGTNITIIGRNLLIGNQSIQVTFSDGTVRKNCMIYEKNFGIPVGIGDKIKCTTPEMETETAHIILTFDGQTKKYISENFIYLENPVIGSIQPNKSMASGGIKLTITGKYLNNTQDVMIEMAEDTSTAQHCDVFDNGTKMICKTPELSEEQKKKFIQVKSDSTNRKRRSTSGSCSGCFEIVIKMDGFKTTFTLSYTVDPSLLNLTGDNSVHIFSTSKDRTLTIKGSNLLWERGDIVISIGYENCALVEVRENNISCSPPAQQPRSDHRFPDVSVKIGNFKQTVGYLKYEDDNKAISTAVISVIASIAGVLFLVLVLVAVICLRKSRQLKRKAEELEKQIQDWEMEIRNVSREEFADLQTSIKEVTSSLVERGFPYRDYKYYSFKMLFPTADMETHIVILDPQVSDDMRIRLKKGMDMLEDLLYNKFFLKSLIQTMERQPQKKFSQRERANFSSVLSVVLLGKMEYFYEILEILLPDLVKESINKKSHKALFRRCESVTEKLLMNLFSLCLYPYLKKHGSSLYMMFKAIQIRMEKGPIDQLTGHAKYTLSEDQLLKKQSATGSDLVLESKPLKLSVGVLDQYYECTVLDCDTITQVKDKCLAQIYINFPASNRGTADDIVLEWHAGSSGCLQLHDIDVSNHVSDGWKRLNTLAHYNVWDGCKMALVETNRQEEDYVNLSPKQIHFEMIGATESVQLMPSNPQSTTSETDHLCEIKLWHVVKPEDESQKRGKTKDLVELYLNRLLSMKISILPYIKELFDSILDANGVPTIVKTFYDLLDNLADQHKLDEDTLHVWKSHSYPIRFWASLITKPDVVFDINKPGYTDQCLEIISQTFIDSFSTTSHAVNKESATHKLLFTAEMDEYHDKVNEFYSDVKSATAVSALDFQQDMKELNKEQIRELAYNKISALFEIFNVIDSFMVDVIDDLQESPEARTLRLADRLDELVSIIKESEEETCYSDFPGGQE